MLRPVRWPVTAPRLSRVYAAAAVLVAATALLPPIGSGSRHHLWVEGAQFLLLACALPALTALALPARWRPVRPGRPWMISALLLETADLGLWRSKAAVDGIAHHPWLASLEGICLLAGGAALWSFMLATPLRGPSYPWRMALAAFAMWWLWILAYLVGFSSATWYPAYASHSGWSVRAEQQITTAMLWAGAGLAFLPVIFWGLWQWLAPERNHGA